MRKGEDHVRQVIGLLKGFPGHPSHPPLTDASIGAYTVGVAMLVLGALGVEEKQMAHGGLLALSGGLLLAAPTAVTGLLDWLDLDRGSPARTLATVHLFTMVSATVVFAAAWLLQRPGYVHGTVKPGGWIVAVIGELLLAAGGYLGGTIVFVYGHRVVGRPQTSLQRALLPSAAPTSDRPGPDERITSTEGPSLHRRR
jgi:uncharacterized membrane protein